MDFDDTREEAAFRAEAREWLGAHAEPKRGAFETWQSRYPGREGWDGLERAKAFQSKKAEAGFAALHWPAEWGGRALPPIYQVIYAQEESKFLVPRGYFEIGLGMCMPTLFAYGTEAFFEQPLELQAEHAPLYDCFREFYRVEPVRCRTREGRIDLADLLDKLGQRGVTHLMVEGGARVATAFLAEGLVDRLLAFVAPRVVGGDGLAWAAGPGPRRMAGALRLDEVEVARCGDDVLVSGTVGARSRKIAPKRRRPLAIPPSRG